MLTREAKLLITAECTAVLIAFGRYRDQLNADDAAALMARDGVWDRDGQLLTGPAPVREAILGMPRELVLRHIFTNITIDVIDDTHANGLAYYTVYGDRNAPADTRRPVRLEGPTRVGDYVCNFVKEDEAWRISYVNAMRVFSK